MEAEQEGDQKQEKVSEQEQEEIENAKTNGTVEKASVGEQSQETATGSSDSEKKRPNAIDMKKAIQQRMSSILLKNKIEIKIPPIWTPTDNCANAALIYLYFRSVSWWWSLIEIKM